MKKPFWEYVLNAGWKVQTGVARLFGGKKAPTAETTVVDDNGISTQTEQTSAQEQEDKVREPNGQENTATAHENDATPSVQENADNRRPEAETAAVTDNDTSAQADPTLALYYEDESRKLNQDEKLAQDILDIWMRGQSPKKQMEYLQKEKKFRQEEQAKYEINGYHQTYHAVVLREIERREKLLKEKSADVFAHENDATPSVQENTDNRPEAETVADFEESQPTQQNIGMERWTRSEANFQAYMAAKRDKESENSLDLGVLNQSVSVTGEGVTLSPFGSLLFGENKSEQKMPEQAAQSVVPETTGNAEEPASQDGIEVPDPVTEDVSVPQPTPQNMDSEVASLSAEPFEVVDPMAGENAVFVDEVNVVEPSESRLSDIHDIPFETVRTGLTPTQQTVVKAGIAEFSARSKNETASETLPVTKKAGLKDLIHQVAAAHSEAMETAKKRLETEPAPLVVLPKRRRKKPIKNVLRQISAGDNNVHVVETKTEKGQVIQDGKITRTIHVQQVKTDVLITETMPAPALVPDQKSASALPTGAAASKTVKIPQKGKTTKKATSKPVRKKRSAGVKRGANMERVSMMLQRFKGIEK